MRKLLPEVPLLEAVARRCSVKRVFLEILQKFTGKQCARVSVLIKLQASACNFIKKETLTQVFSCKFCKISKKTFGYRAPPVAASTTQMFYCDPCEIFKNIYFDEHLRTAAFSYWRKKIYILRVSIIFLVFLFHVFVQVFLEMNQRTLYLTNKFQ